MLVSSINQLTRKSGFDIFFSGHDAGLLRVIARPISEVAILAVPDAVFQVYNTD